jgi:hypothetical protein
MMKKALFLLAGLVLAVVTASAQSQTVKGTLIDNACFQHHKSQAELTEHTRDCALMDACVKSGYTVVTTDGHAYKLDDKGNADLLAALKASTKENDLKVTVTGTVANDTIAVSTIALDQ